MQSNWATTKNISVIALRKGRFSFAIVHAQNIITTWRCELAPRLACLYTYHASLSLKINHNVIFTQYASWHVQSIPFSSVHQHWCTNGIQRVHHRVVHQGVRCITSIYSVGRATQAWYSSPTPTYTWIQRSVQVVNKQLTRDIIRLQCVQYTTVHHNHLQCGGICPSHYAADEYILQWLFTVVNIHTELTQKCLYTQQ